MTAGAITQPNRPAYEANERFDTQDAEASSAAPREYDVAMLRSILSTPLNVGGTSPTGLIITGFELTPNPTSGTDGLVGIGTDAGVALDADGGMIIKLPGNTYNISVPSGTNQIYAYFVETPGTNATRRFIPAAAPFVEYSQVIPTQYLSDIGFYVRAGDATSFLASDVVNGATTPLVAIGVATNSGGTITITGYNASTAPNGSAITNRLPSIAAAPTLPSTPVLNSPSVLTLHDLINTVAYMVGQAIWKGSHNLTPSAANNFGAFTPPTVGIDGLFDSQGENVVTPVTKWRDWQQNNRLLVDHNGFPGGQISVKDEFWENNGKTIHIDPTVGFLANGVGSGVAADNGALSITASSGAAQWIVPLSGYIPNGAVITGITAVYESGAGTNQLTIALVVNSLTSSTFSVQVTKTVTTSTTGAKVAVNIGVSPTGGSLPKQYSAADKEYFAINAPVFSGSLFVYDIQVTYAMPAPVWTFTQSTGDNSSAGDQCNFLDPASGMNQRQIQLITNSVSGFFAGQSQLQSENECYVDNDIVHVTEFFLETGNVDDSSHEAGFLIGTDLPDSGDSWQLWWLRNTYTNWQLKFSDDANDYIIDSGVAVTANTIYRVKLEYAGSNRTSTGHARARLWLNGALVATANSTSTVTASRGCQVISASTTSSTVGGPYDFRVGRYRRAWNHIAAGDNV